MKTRSLKRIGLASVLALAVWAAGLRAAAQTPADIEIQLYAGLTITGTVGSVYSIEYVTDMAQANTPGAWQCLDYLRLPSSPCLWTDTSVPATEKRFYRAVQMQAPAGMVYIPAGTFTMGSPADETDRRGDEGPQTAVVINRWFWMGRCEVTQAEYEALMGNNPSEFRGDPSRPVDSVSWNDAVFYCLKLTQRERAAGRIPPTWYYRLPTEAEWEYAARAGTSTRFGYGGDAGYFELENFGWYELNSGGETHPVGQKLPNAWGLCDTHGNVSEWCQDWYAESLPGGISIDPQGPATGATRVLRGGDWVYWGDGASRCRSAYRNSYFPESGYSNFGFRIVLAP